MRGHIRDTERFPEPLPAIESLAMQTGGTEYPNSPVLNPQDLKMSLGQTWCYLVPRILVFPAFYPPFNKNLIGSLVHKYSNKHFMYNHFYKPQQK